MILSIPWFRIFKKRRCLKCRTWTTHRIKFNNAKQFSYCETCADAFSINWLIRSKGVKR